MGFIKFVVSMLIILARLLSRCFPLQCTVRQRAAPLQKKLPRSRTWRALPRRRVWTRLSLRCTSSHATSSTPHTSQSLRWDVLPPAECVKECRWLGHWPSKLCHGLIWHHNLGVFPPLIPRNEGMNMKRGNLKKDEKLVEFGGEKRELEQRMEK